MDNLIAGIFFWVSLSLLILIVLYSLPWILMDPLIDLHKPSPLEAGFSPGKPIHSSFSLQFICLVIIFIIFDTEFFLVFGLVMNTSWAMVVNLLLIWFMFITFYLELKADKLLWLK